MPESKSGALPLGDIPMKCCPDPDTRRIITRSFQFCNTFVAISAGANHTVALKSDGTVVATGDNRYNNCDVVGWENIVTICAASFHTVGLKSDGTIITVGRNDTNQCDINGMSDIKLPE